jgi:putative ABC transport system substrate-binding protein
LVLALLVAPLAADAQQAGKVYRIGFLAVTESAWPSAITEVFRQALRELDHVEGRNLVVEYRSAEGYVERLPALATELVKLNVDVIFTSATAGALAARNATTTIPIVFSFVGDPVGAGLVTSLARPGGNVTGTSNLSLDLIGKRLELLPTPPEWAC